MRLLFPSDSKLETFIHSSDETGMEMSVQLSSRPKLDTSYEMLVDLEPEADFGVQQKEGGAWEAA